MSDVAFALMDNAQNPKPTDPKGEDVNQLISQLNEERFKHAGYSLLCGALEDSLDEDLIKGALASKIREVFLSCETSQSVEITSNDSTFNVLGIRKAQPPVITYEDKQVIKDVLKVKLNSKRATVHGDLQRIFGDYNAVQHNKALLDLRGNLLEITQEYVGNLIRQSELLQELVALRTEILPEVSRGKIVEAQTRIKATDCKARIVNEKVRVSVFTETGCALSAYSEIVKDIVAEQHECRREIGELRELKGRYETVASRDFDEILKSYLQYKRGVDKMNDLHEKLRIKR